MTQEILNKAQLKEIEYWMSQYDLSFEEALELTSVSSYVNEHTHPIPDIAHDMEEDNG